MNITNCRHCGRLFNVLSNEKLCPECRKQLEDKFQEVKRYLQEHPKSPMNAVAEELDVPIKQIREWVREERLVLTEPSDAGITCECCGRMICTGKYCDECRLNMTLKLRSAFSSQTDTDKQEKRDRERMRYLKK